MLMPKLSYKEEVNIIELQTITSKGNQHLAALGLWEGQGDFQFKQFGIKSNKDDVFIITGFKCNSIVDIKETIINFIFGWRIESIFELSSTTKAGPLALTISVDNINGEALRKIQEFGYAVTNDPAMADKVNAAWKNFFVSKIKVKLKNTEFNLPQGKLTVEADVNIGGIKLEAITPAIIMKTVDGVAKIEMPKALAYEIAAKKIEHDIILEAKDFDLSHEGEKMPKPYKLTLAGKKEEIEKRVLAEVKKLIDEKFIIEKDKTFFAEIKMKDGIIMVNEKPLPLGM
jgi:uncharacterized protein YdgA (DUF945 family)